MSQSKYRAVRLPPKSKYFNKKTVCLDNHQHDSKKEAARCDQLRLLERAGEIKDLAQQPTFGLQPSFRLGGKTIRAITYAADFQYREKGKTIVEDCKGVKTQVYQLKKRLFLYRVVYARRNWEFVET